MKTNNNKSMYKTLSIFGILFVVICCNVLYKASFIDIVYLFIILTYFGRYLYIKRV